MNKLFYFLILFSLPIYSIEPSPLKGEIIDYVEKLEHYHNYGAYVYVYYLVVLCNGEVRTVVHEIGPCNHYEYDNFFKKSGLKKGDLIEISNEEGHLSFNQPIQYFKSIVTTPSTEKFNQPAQREGFFLASNPFSENYLENLGNYFKMTGCECHPVCIINTACTYTFEGFRSEKFQYITGNPDFYKHNEYIQYIGPCYCHNGFIAYRFHREGLKAGYYEVKK